MTQIKLLLAGLVLAYLFYGFKHRDRLEATGTRGYAQTAQCLDPSLEGMDAPEARRTLQSKEKALESAIEQQRAKIGQLYQTMSQLPPERMKVVQYCCGKVGFRKTESGLTGVQCEVNNTQQQIEGLETQLKRTREQLASLR